MERIIIKLVVTIAMVFGMVLCFTNILDMIVTGTLVKKEKEEKECSKDL